MSMDPPLEARATAVRAQSWAAPAVGLQVWGLVFEISGVGFEIWGLGCQDFRVSMPGFNAGFQVRI